MANWACGTGSWKPLPRQDRAGVSQDVISLAERDRIEDVSVRTLRSHVRALGRSCASSCGSAAGTSTACWMKFTPRWPEPSPLGWTPSAARSGPKSRSRSTRSAGPPTWWRGTPSGGRCSSSPAITPVPVPCPCPLHGHHRRDGTVLLAPLGRRPVGRRGSVRSGACCMVAARTGRRTSGGRASSGPRWSSTCYIPAAPVTMQRACRRRTGRAAAGPGVLPPTKDGRSAGRATGRRGISRAKGPRHLPASAGPKAPLWFQVPHRSGDRAWCASEVAARGARRAKACPPEWCDLSEAPGTG